MSPIPLGILALAGAGAAGAYDLLETQVLSSSAASVTFTGLGSYSDYKHLQIRVTTRATTSGQNSYYMTFNNDTGNNYAYHRLFGDGSSVSSAASTSQPYIYAGRMAESTDGADEFAATVTDILDFNNANKNTTVRLLTGHTAGGVRIGLISGLWDDTSAVTEIDLTTFSNFEVGSRFSLYGVK